MSRIVMIVDDSKLARMSAAKVLGKLRPEWTLLEAANASDALAMAASTKIDIILLDFNMPGGDGLTLAADLRKLYPDMPLAVISANEQQEVVARARNAGATFLVKPITEAGLGGFIDAAAQQLERRA